MSFLSLETSDFSQCQPRDASATSGKICAFHKLIEAAASVRYSVTQEMMISYLKEDSSTPDSQKLSVNIMLYVT